jgi:hypothetical protein
MCMTISMSSDFHGKLALSIANRRLNHLQAFHSQSLLFTTALAALVVLSC